MRTKHLLLVFALLVLGGVAALNVERLFKLTPSTTTSHTAAHEPAYFFTDFTLSSTNAQGQTDYRLQGQKLVSYQDDSTAEVTQPQLAVYNSAAADWSAVAQQAWISADGELVELSGNVLLTQQAFKDQPEVRISSQKARLQPQRKYAETDQPVHLESLHWQIDAIGMTADMPAGLVTFLSSVKGIYAPAQP